MIIRDYKYLIKLQHIHTEQMYLKYVKVRWWCSSERLVGKYVDCPFDNKITTHPYGTNAYKVCESEMVTVKDLFVDKYISCPFCDEIILQMTNIRD